MDRWPLAQTPDLSSLTAAFVLFSMEVWVWPPFRVFAMVTLVLATIWAIAKVYSGDLQNAEKGPLGLRPHKNSSLKTNTIVLPHHLISMTMDGVHAKCSFYFVYDDVAGKRRHERLLSSDMMLSVSPRPLYRPKSGTIIGNEVADAATEDVCFPLLDLEGDAPPPVIDKTPSRAVDYVVQNKVLERWSGDDAVQMVSVHQDVLDNIVDARRAFTQGRIAKLHAARSARLFRRWRSAHHAKRRPGAVGNYYVKFQFSNDPVFVLRRHPDRDVRMTAWLTVLTSVFAIVMELFPLQLERDDIIRGKIRRTELEAPSAPARSGQDARAYLIGKSSAE